MDKSEVKKKIGELTKKLLQHQFLYYIKSTPEISDSEYDRLFDELKDLEKRFPEFINKNSPSKRIGSDLDHSFPEKNHSTPVLSLDKEYKAGDLIKWARKLNNSTGRDLSFTVEEKIDGASIVLYYKKGMLEYALTRGNGITGNDVTENIRTINQIPLMVKTNADLAVRGEIFIKKSDFSTFNKKFENKYANPRNLASGSLRNIKSSVTAMVPLNLVSYEGFFSDQDLDTHTEILARLNALGFPTGKSIGLFSDNKKSLRDWGRSLPWTITGPLSDLEDFIGQKSKDREKLDYEIDGLVVKVNELDIRAGLGSTTHHPRWAMAFKFDSPTAETLVHDIEIGVGRNGRVTPVAILKPVKIAGSTVSRATLHNQEYIDMLELSKQDTVSISKRGDIIPAVEKVLEKNRENIPVYKLPENCPFCSARLVKDGSHHFCRNRECPERVKRSLSYFVSKDQMDIDTLGDKTISLLLKHGLLKTIPDIYNIDYSKLLELEGFKEKKINNIRTSIEKSKQQQFSRILTALGFDGIGSKAVNDLISNGFDSAEKIIAAAALKDPEIFTRIEGFGQITAEQLIAHFTDPENLRLIEELKKLGLNFRAAKQEFISDKFKGQTWVITGSLTYFSSRSKAAEEIKKRGGRVTGSVSAKTTHLLSGASPGSKFELAKKHNAIIIDEEQFLELLSQ